MENHGREARPHLLLGYIPETIYYFDCEVENTCSWGITTRDKKDGERQRDEHMGDHDLASQFLIAIAEAELWKDE